MNGKAAATAPRCEAPAAQSDGGVGRAWLLVLLLATAAGLRSWDLGALSFWYDEVVSMRLAETPGPAALVARLAEIDATRAPLHPLLLQGWIHLFGTSEAAGRALSVLCGVLTVGLVSWVGRMVFDPATGLWAAGLSAISPLLVYYSREARMYALLVLLACLCWGLLFSLREARGRAFRFRVTAYVLSLTAMIYTHPLGLLMAAALALGSLVESREVFGSRGRWLLFHALGLGLAAPWLPRYFDHAPEFLSGRLPLKFLLGTPIGFLGGNALVLLVLIAVAVLGLVLRARARRSVRNSDLLGLLIWLGLPPVILYAYSWVGSPIFGPSRYTLYVAPAYLILVAQGLAQLPRLPRLLAAAAILALAGQSLATTVYAAGLKADWRAFAQVLAVRLKENPAARVTVLVPSPDPASGRNFEVETARYYLPARCRVVGLDNRAVDPDPPAAGEERYLAVGLRAPAATAADRAPDGWDRDQSFPGLAVYRPRVP